MRKTVLAMLALTGVSACGGGIYDTGAFREPAFANQGAQQCPQGTTSNDSLLQASPTSPLRCGPQAQAIPGGAQT